MTPKTWILVATLFLALAAPLGMSHNDSQATYPVTDTNDKPSGIYVGSAGVYGVAIVANTKSQSTLARGQLCDLEVVEGSAPHAADESMVDGTVGGSAPDGTWDDGGYGGVCHVANHYAYAPYNSPGCAGSYDRAWARDDNQGDSVWISTACDSVTRINGVPFPYTPVLVDGAACTVAAVVGNLDPVPCLTGALDEFWCYVEGHPVLWFTSQPCPHPFPPAPGGLACGPDGVPDASNFGTGDGSQAPWSGGVAYPAVYPGCADGDGAAEVLVWDAVQIGNGSPDRILLANHGWIN